MTTLSIFLYLADILNSLSAFVTIGGILCVFAPLFAFLGKDEFNIENPGKCFKLCIPITVLCFLIACVIPDKKTMYMIAGVELANSVMQSDDFNKVKNYLGETAKELIKETKKGGREFGAVCIEKQVPIKRTKCTISNKTVPFLNNYTWSYPVALECVEE